MQRIPLRLWTACLVVSKLYTGSNSTSLATKLIRTRLTSVPGRTDISSILITGATFALSACVTPARMHTDAQLNDVALGCGLALGELMQDEAEKKLLLTIRQEPTVQQRSCVTKWARKNGLKPVFVNMDFQS